MRKRSPEYLEKQRKAQSARMAAMTPEQRSAWHRKRLEGRKRSYEELRAYRENAARLKAAIAGIQGTDPDFAAQTSVGVDTHYDT